MTHMDDQVAKHIQEMVRRATRKVGQYQEQPPKPDTLSRIVQGLKQGPDDFYDLIPPRHLLLRDDRSEP
jgi:hypothetical protein